MLLLCFNRSGAQQEQPMLLAEGGSRWQRTDRGSR